MKTMFSFGDLKKEDFICENGEETIFKDVLLSKETTQKYSKEIILLQKSGKSMLESIRIAKLSLEKYFNKYMEKFYGK